MTDNLPAVRPEVLEGVIDQECRAHCSHGGYCTENYGHPGRHDADGYCQWDDKDSVSAAEADQILSAKPGGVMAVVYDRMLNGPY